MGAFRQPGPQCNEGPWFDERLERSIAALTRQSAPNQFGLSLGDFGSPKEAEFRKKVYARQVQHMIKDRKKQFFPGLPEAELAVADEAFNLRVDVAQQCEALLAHARADLLSQQLTDKQARKVKSIGIASAYRDPQRDLRAWKKAFAKHYKRTKATRAAFGDEHGEAAVEYLYREMRGIKGPPGFSNHTSGIAVDFETTEDGSILGRTPIRGLFGGRLGSMNGW
jgi:D-alanyl-D-alanine carboxypeptidase